MAQMCGGLGQVMDATDEVRGICKEVKEEVLSKCGKNSFEIYEVIKYRSQVVAGTNYFVKIRISPDECIHIKLFQALPCYGGKLEVTSVQTGKKEADPIE